jgi:hypothetical protein
MNMKVIHTPNDVSIKHSEILHSCRSLTRKSKSHLFHSLYTHSTIQNDFKNMTEFSTVEKENDFEYKFLHICLLQGTLLQEEV